MFLKAYYHSFPETSHGRVYERQHINASEHVVLKQWKQLELVIPSFTSTKHSYVLFTSFVLPFLQKWLPFVNVSCISSKVTLEAGLHKYS